MLQLFFGRCKVDRGCCTCCICCKCFRSMLQAFVQNIHLFPDVRCNRFLSRCCICFHTYVATVCSKCFTVLVLCCNKYFFHVAIVFIWMLYMFYTHVASVCPKYFFCFKCMLHLSVSRCKCRPPALVSMRVGRAKLRPPTHGGDAGRRRAVWGGGTARTVLLWNRRRRVFRTDWKSRASRQCRKGGGESSD
jgi:hypothetical protein